MSEFGSNKIIGVMIRMADRMSKVKLKILGVWDLTEAPLTLGRLLLFIEELQIQRVISQAGDIEVAILGDSTREPEPSLTSVLMGLENVVGYYRKNSLKDLSDFLDLRDYVIWPPLQRGKHIPTSTLLIQQFYREYQYIPLLSCKKKLLDWGQNYFSRLGIGCPVIVHLKNNPQQHGCSNARQDVWFNFFKSCRADDVAFVLIGDDVVDTKITALKHVVRSKLGGSDLAQDLALIQLGSFFMGMASGPCNMAILNTRPFVIYKNPDHDTEEMQREIGAGMSFNFSEESQRLIREYETGQGLLAEFKRMRKETGIINSRNEGLCCEN